MIRYNVLPLYNVLTTNRLLAIKDKLKQQRQHMEDLDKHMSVIIAWR